MILMSFFPSTWYSVMNPLVEEYQILKTGNINGNVRKIADQKTREFIVKVTYGILLITLINWLMLKVTG